MKKPKHRDINIAKSATMELDLSTKSIPSKKQYTRKVKHKKKDQ